ncbi:AAA family ATPase [Desulfonema magnum]|uniref:APH domain-containing protein n=1 Tax=Desulfonema magnum TaxID=45655 RepID=A0A975BWQ2_9BACT|nr:bifunctional aminoglycoside phosphotransferase/ATP-binding protein [Desulfonema magnum]QTA92752.1 APH domain-containing protein [Desulfonema magnum]
MKAQHQTKIFQAMKSPDFYPHPVTSLEERETHISKVFLTGSYVYKIKKAVNLEFLDFTSLEKRLHFCQQELVLNRRLAPDVYLDVVPITFSQGRYSLGGNGPPVEYAVKMRQLPDDRAMKGLLGKSEIDKKVIEELARVLAEFYSQASTGERVNAVGTWETIQANCEENFSLSERFAGKLFDERIFQIVRAASRSFLRRRKALFQHRIEHGKIRDCHGDLRTDHIYFTDDGIRIIDCIEFNERFRYQDITCDLAFLTMGLDYEGFPQFSQQLLSAYVEHTDDHDVFVLLDFYKCYRAFVRCKVNCFRIEQGGLDEQERNDLIRETEKYLDFASRYALQFTRPTLWIVCGMPASGKSTVSEELAKAFEIKVFHSDIVRKELFSATPDDSGVVPFGEGIYSVLATSFTYGKLLLLAQEEIDRGNSVILDATYSSERWRTEASRLAKDHDVNIIFAECVASDDLLKERLRKRETTSSVSDARIHHFEQFRKRYEPLKELQDEIHIQVDTEKPLGECMKQILSSYKTGNWKY